MGVAKYNDPRTGQWHYLNTRSIVIQAPGGTIDPSTIDLSDYYKKGESDARYLQQVIHIGDTPPENTNMLWFDTSDTSPSGGINTGVSIFKGIFNYRADIPPDGNKAGDICKVLETNSYYIYNGNEWDIIGGGSGGTDPALQAKVNSLESRVTDLENNTPASADDFVPAVITDEEVSNIVNTVMRD